jgi:hypothetical protein
MFDVRFGLSVMVEERFDKTFVVLAGELDISNVSLLVDALGSVRPEKQVGVVVDVGSLDFALPLTSCNRIRGSSDLI